MQPSHTSGRTPDICFSLPFLPPSSNHIYVNKRGGGGRFLSTESKQFKVLFKNHLGENYFMEINALDPDAIYKVSFQFRIPAEDILNKTFGKRNGSPSKYKKLDASNRIKLIEDCLKDVIGIDDSQFFIVEASKLIAQKPGVLITLSYLKESDIRVDSWI